MRIRDQSDVPSLPRLVVVQRGQRLVLTLIANPYEFQKRCFAIEGVRPLKI